MMCCTVLSLSMFFMQGERGHAFYIVESGQLSAFKDNSPLPVLSYGPGARLIHRADITRVFDLYRLLWVWACTSVCS